MFIKFGLVIAISVVLLHSAPAGEERRIVGYANGKPMYLNGAAPVRRVAATPARVRVRQATAPRVHIGSTGCYHGTPAYSGGAYHDGGSYGLHDGYYGYNQGYAYRGGYGWGGGRRHNCGVYTQPYPAAASRGYSWVPRYGSTSTIPRYSH
jgi:hypothetical protein